MNALNFTFAGIAQALSPRRQRYFVTKQSFGRSALSGMDTHTVEFFDRETGKTWRCHGHQLNAITSGEDEPSEDWLTLVDEDVDAF